MLQKIEVSELCLGMFVTQVTKQTGNIKITSSGPIKTEKDLSNLVNKGILQVEIDLAKSTHQQSAVDKPSSEDDYLNASGLSYSEQIKLSLKLYDQAKEIHGRIIRNVSKGKIKNIDDIEEVSRKIVDIVFECDDAVSIVTLLNDHSDYLLEHGINCTILMTIFGKHLGLSRKSLYQLGIGALLMDIGMVKMPLLLTEKPSSLSPKETEKMKTHVVLGLTLLENFDSISKLSLEVIKQHHERLDGSGYPNSLRAEQISQHGRMAAIIDVYDSLTAKRPYREVLPPAQALIKLKEEVVGLDATLVNSFIECIGTYPIGSVVKLQSGKLAMVMRLNKKAPLKPIVMAFYDVNTKNESAPRQLDLTKTDDAILSSILPADFSIELVVFLKQVFTTK